MNIYFIYLFLWVYGQHRRKFNRNIVERITFDIPNTHIHDAIFPDLARTGI